MDARSFLGRETNHNPYRWVLAGDAGRVRTGRLRGESGRAARARQPVQRRAPLGRPGAA